jgi:L-Ala-D/L-Glu epimerase / N-acetyl-D-glutamate racemase
VTSDEPLFMMTSFTLPLREPFVSSRGVVGAVSLSVVSLIHRTTGTVGVGEVLGEDTRSGVELAQIDLEARLAKQPVWRALGAQAAPPVEVNATIATDDPARAAAAAAAARERGFTTIKVKVGAGENEDRLAGVRAAAGPEMQIRIDANGAWSADQAIAELRRLQPIGIECCEQPCATLAEVARVADSVAVPVSLDESTVDPAAFDRRICTAVCLKVARCGGIKGLLEAARRARAVGYEVYLASMLDGAIGIAAALHAAAVIKPDRPCGLATLALFEGREDPFPPHEGRIAVPGGPGLGALLSWY